jgi:hypothetical protein
MANAALGHPRLGLVLAATVAIAVALPALRRPVAGAAAGE